MIRRSVQLYFAAFFDAFVGNVVFEQHEPGQFKMFPNLAVDVGRQATAVLVAKIGLLCERGKQGRQFGFLVMQFLNPRLVLHVQADIVQLFVGFPPLFVGVLFTLFQFRNALCCHFIRMAFLSFQYGQFPFQRFR